MGPDQPHHGWDALEGARLTADPDFVDAVMHAYTFNEWAPSDLNRDTSGYPRTQREGAITRNPENFYPPAALSPKDKATSQTRRFWQEMADQVLGRAQAALFQDDERFPAIKGKYEKPDGPVLSIHHGYAQRNNQANLYFNIDGVRNGRPPLENAEIVQAAVDEVRAAVEAKVRQVLEDGNAMAEIGKIIDFSEKVDALVTFQQQIARLEYIRGQVERPEQVEQFIDLMQQATALLLPGADVTVKPLPVEISLMHGAKALYKPGSLKPELEGKSLGDLLCGDLDPGTRLAGSEVFMPFSHYGTDQLIELDECWQLLAHELAHHILADYAMGNDYPSYGILAYNRLDGSGRPFYKEGELVSEADRKAFRETWETTGMDKQDAHNLVHNILTQTLLKKLRALNFTVLPSNSEGNSTDKPRIMLTPPIPEEARQGLDPELFVQTAELEARVRELVEENLKAKEAKVQPTAPVVPTPTAERVPATQKSTSVPAPGVPKQSWLNKFLKSIGM